jgi:hypothetical protein
MSPFSVWERFNLLLDMTLGVTTDEAIARTCDDMVSGGDDL